jgi:hypothetical protein
LPAGIDSLDARIAIGNGWVDATLCRRNGELGILLKSGTGRLDIRLDWKAGDLFAANLVLPAGGTLDLTAGTSLKGAPDVQVQRTPSGTPEPMKFAIPPVAPVVRGPGHRLLTNGEIKQAAGADAVTLFDASDPAGDEKYTYPTTSMLEPGSLDITRCTVSADRKNVSFLLRFSGLSNPGWHPEYGFQLTYVAIAVDRDGKPGSGQTGVGMNSRYTLDRRHACERIIYVGGGVQVADAEGGILAEYIPVPGDERNPLGDAEAKTIAFSIPVDLLGKPDASWRFTVLVGAQDDHGGAGIGDFRNVETGSAGEWTGGGKKRAGDPNVYDVILPRR